MLHIADLSTAQFRLNAAYRPVRIEDLSPSERAALGDIRPGDGVAYLWIPRAFGLSAKAVDAETATALLTLESPGPLSPASQVTFAADPAALARLILDSMIEVEIGGDFVSGPRAAETLDLELPEGSGNSAVATVSIEALEYGAALGLEDGPALSARLYFFNREPRSPAWARTLPSAGALERWLGIDDGSPLRHGLDTHWGGPRMISANPDWVYFRRSGTKERRLKLYVAPATRTLPVALPEIVAAFEQHGVGTFKIGRSLAGILRPDKLVAYLDSFDEVGELGADIVGRLQGISAQPVPFSVGLDPEGLTSWGIDPPADEKVSTWQGPSWRRWITDRLAVALVSAQAAGTPSPKAFALQRIALDGIDPHSWAPVSLSWAMEPYG